MSDAQKLASVKSHLIVAAQLLDEMDHRRESVDGCPFCESTRAIRDIMDRLDTADTTDKGTSSHEND